MCMGDFCGCGKGIVYRYVESCFGDIVGALFWMTGKIVFSSIGNFCLGRGGALEHFYICLEGCCGNFSVVWVLFRQPVVAVV